MTIKDRQAQEYAEKILNENSAFELDYFGLPQAWLDGYTACEQSDLRISVAKLREVLDLIECAVQMIIWLINHGYQLTGIEKGGDNE